MPKTQTAAFREMDRAECDAILARNHVGRLAFAFHARVDIEPIHYVYEDGFIYTRTGAGTKLVMLEHQPYVAFEVDEVDAIFRWRSVVVHSTVYRVEPSQDPRTHVHYERAVRALKRLVPAAFTAHDPMPDRTVVFRMLADEVTGRAADLP